MQLHRAEMEARFGHESVTAYDHETQAAGRAATPAGLHPLLVPLKSDGDSRRVHGAPARRHRGLYRELARLFDPARPLYGVLVAASTARAAAESLAEMAAD